MPFYFVGSPEPSGQSAWSTIIAAEDRRLRELGVPFESTSDSSTNYRASNTDETPEYPARYNNGRQLTQQIQSSGMGPGWLGETFHDDFVWAANAACIRANAALPAGFRAAPLAYARPVPVTYFSAPSPPVFRNAHFRVQNSVNPLQQFDYGSQFVSYNPADETAFDFKDLDKTLINNEVKLRAFLPKLLELSQSHPDCPDLAMDSEGYDLGRHGTLTVLQMRIRIFRHTYVFDIKRLGGRAFFDVMEQGVSLRAVLESPEYLQVWWDIRQDRDALNYHFGVDLGWTVDLQLVELAARPKGMAKDRVYSLSNCISKYGPNFMYGRELQDWLRLNAEGKEYFREFGYKLFDNRPLKGLAWEYAAADVHLTLDLFDHLWRKLSSDMKALVQRETKRRMDESVSYNKPQGSNLAPEAFRDLE